MYFKDQRYQKAKASTFASTHTVELPDSGLLDSINMYFRATISQAAPLAPANIHHNISKIEVIGDSDKILYSLSGEEALAKAYRKIGALPPMNQNELSKQSCDQLIPIFFGKHYKDGHYALDLSKWDKVELQVTNTFVSTLFTAASLSMETRLCTIEDSAETHPKFLKQWEYEADKPDSDGDYLRPKLPTKGLLRSLMIQLDPDLEDDTAEMVSTPTGDSYNWKLWLKDRSLTMFDHRVKDLMRNEHKRLGIGSSSCKPYPAAARYTDFHWAVVLEVAVSALSQTSTHGTPPCLEDSRDRYQKIAAAGTATWYQALIRGIGLFHTFEIPFYLPDDLESNYFNLDTYKPVEIEWYGHKDDHTHRIILEKPIGQGPAEFA